MARMAAPIPRAVVPEAPRANSSKRLRDMRCPFCIRRPGSGGGGPGARGGGAAGEVGEVARRATQGALDAVGQMRVAPVQRLTCDGGEDVGHEGAARLRDVGVEVVEADRDVSNLASGG